MDDYFQRTLRRRRLLKAAAAWAGLIAVAAFATVGLWACLVVVIGALA